MQHPGQLYVAATLLPLASFLLLLLAGAIRAAARSYQGTPVGAALYQALGGARPTRVGAYIATAAMGSAFVLSVIGFALLFPDQHHRYDLVKTEIPVLEQRRVSRVRGKRAAKSWNTLAPKWSTSIHAGKVPSPGRAYPNWRAGLPSP